MLTHILNNLALLINLHHAGINMIPSEGWKQAFEAWAADKTRDVRNDIS